MLEGELAEAYDYVSPCFPPHYNIFDSIFQLYHVQFAQVSHRAGQLGLEGPWGEAVQWYACGVTGVATYKV